MADLHFLFPQGFNANKYAIPAKSTEPPILMAHRVLTDAGYKPPYLTNGQLIRFPDKYDMEKGDKRGQGGWCIFNEVQHGDETIGIMSYGSWHEGDKQIWSSVSSDYMTAPQRQSYLDAIESARRIRDDEEARLKEKAQIEFNRLWDGYPDASDNHPYLVKKQVKPHGIKQDNDKLVVPCYLNGALVGLQDIYPDGSKYFRKHSTKGYFIIGDINADKVLIAEGYSTGASIHEATGLTVAIAFDAGNLFNTASALKDNHTLVICADDDKHGEINTGLDKANAIKKAIGCRVIAPICNGTDFNDMASERGLIAVNEHILTALEIKQPRKTAGDRKIEAMRPTGAMGAIYDYYNATSGFVQRGFAIQTALAICSVICGRNYRNNNDNFTSIYLLNIGKTATGKEHCKTVINKIMEAANMEKHVIGDGFTSSGAVMTELLRKPRCISVIDEFGMYLESAGSKGNANQKEANSYIMQAISRTHSTMQAKNYSAMTGGTKTDMNDRYVKNPALSIVGLTTPTTFFEAISSKEIHSGFLNRFIISISDTQRMVRNDVEPMPVPANILNWIDAIERRAIAKTPIEVPVERPNFIEITISQPAKLIQREFDQEMVDQMNAHDKDGLDGVFGRAAEMAQKVALICALSRDPQTEIVADVDMIWAVNYIRESYKQMLGAVAENITENQFDKDGREVLKAIEAETGMRLTRTALANKFRGHSSFKLDEILKTLIDAGLLTREITARGRPAEWYIRTESD